MNTPSRKRRKPTRAFTMVELLVVIAIIGILAAILVPTLAAAIRRAREGAILTELRQLEMAFERYKLASGEAYPPDFTPGVDPDLPASPPPPNLQNRLTSHVRKISNKFAPADVNAFMAGIDVDNNLSNGLLPKITPDEALVFWLRRTRTSAQFPLTFDGTYDDPLTNPFDAIKDTCREYFEFDPGRLRDFDGDGYLSYVPPYGAEVPYVYLDSRTYKTGVLNTQDLQPYESANPVVPDGMGVCRPYALSTSQWHNEAKFQIICAGFDGDFGTYPSGLTDLSDTNASNRKLFPSGINFTIGDRDNFATFAEDRLDKELEN